MKFQIKKHIFSSANAAKYFWCCIIRQFYQKVQIQRISLAPKTSQHIKIKVCLTSLFPPYIQKATKKCVSNRIVMEIAWNGTQQNTIFVCVYIRSLLEYDLEKIDSAVWPSEYKKYKLNGFLMLSLKFVSAPGTSTFSTLFDKFFSLLDCRYLIFPSNHILLPAPK